MLRTLAAPSRAIRSCATLRPASQRTSKATAQLRQAPLAAARPAQVALPRWYSGEAQPADKSAAEPPKDDAQAAPPDAESALRKELETKAKEALDWKDKYLRSVADFRNLQDRMAREMKSARDFAIQNFAKDLVDSVDNLDRALGTVPAERLKAPEAAADESDAPTPFKDLMNLHEGLKMTETILIKTLAKHGLERVDPVGDRFNPNEHEATFMAPFQDKEDNTVFHVQQKGFKLNGRTIRPAKVGVVKNS